MAHDTEVERVGPGDRKGYRSAAVPVDERTVNGSHDYAGTDSRVVSREALSYAGARPDIGSKGEQFILASWGNLVAGLFLMIAPFALTYASSAPRAHAHDLIAGMVISTMAATRIFGNYRSGRLNQIISALTVLAGVWLFAASFVLGYAEYPRPEWVDNSTGLATILLGAWSYLTGRYQPDGRYER